MLTSSKANGDVLDCCSSTVVGGGGVGGQAKPQISYPQAPCAMSGSTICWHTAMIIRRDVFVFRGFLEIRARLWGQARELTSGS